MNENKTPKQHWHVVENTPGYLPDSDPAMFTNRRDAGRYARALADSLREDGYHVTGDMRDGYYGERSRSDLGRAIEIMDCGEADCRRID